MIVRTLNELKGGAREVDAGNWVSTRFLLKDDGMGFSMHETIIRAGTATEMHYTRHLEAVYCVGGKGEITLLPDGPTYAIQDGTLYALNGHERHVLKAESDMRMICVFNPPVTGREVHNPDGSYPLPDEHPAPA